MTLREKIELFRSQAEFMPGVVVIHELRDFRPVYMSSKGLELLGITMEELLETGKDYTRIFLNPEFMDDFIEKLKMLLKKNDPEQTYSFFHQVKVKEREDWVWYISSSCLFHQDKTGHPTHTITTAYSIEEMKPLPKKAERLLAETIFVRKNLKKFSDLSQRSREVLKLVALGKSSAEIGDQLNISVNTVNSHRKTVKDKLGISSPYEFAEYALAYDII